MAGDLTLTHMACRNYAPVDVVKGICHRTKGNVSSDGSSCEHFDAKPVCGLCTHYQASEREFIGACGAEKGLPMTYPHLAAVSCDDFVMTAEDRWSTVVE
jgi:hypothetical protein